MKNEISIYKAFCVYLFLYENFGLTLLWIRGLLIGMFCGKMYIMKKPKTEQLHLRLQKNHYEVLKNTSDRYSSSMALVLRSLIERAPMRYEHVNGKRVKVIDFPQILSRVQKIKSD